MRQLLVVDRSFVTQLALGHVLELAGYEVYVADAILTRPINGALVAEIVDQLLGTE